MKPPAAQDCLISTPLSFRTALPAMRARNKMHDRLSYEEGVKKARRYCAYQERCVSEVEEKLKSWGVAGKDRGDIIDALIRDGFVNEQRYAEAYVSGKFRIKAWGRLKIQAGLRTKGVKEETICEVLRRIDEDAYLENLARLLDKKIRETGNFQDRNKVLWYLFSKGYEKELVLQVMRRYTDNN